jgi:hypothetical protein
VRACLRRLQGLPMDGEASTVGIYGAVITLFALLTAWPAPCCNNPAFAEIVPPAQRNLIYAFDRCFEGGWVGGLAGWLAGWLADGGEGCVWSRQWCACCLCKVQGSGLSGRGGGWGWGWNRLVGFVQYKQL